MGSDRLLSEVGDSSMDLMGMYKWECNWECDMRVSITGGSPKMMFLFFLMEHPIFQWMMTFGVPRHDEPETPRNVWIGWDLKVTNNMDHLGKSDKMISQI